MNHVNIRALVAAAGEDSPPFRWEELLRTVAEICHVSVERIASRDRTAAVAFARQLAMSVARDADLTCAEVGRFFGRDHATVSHAVKVIAAVAEVGTARERAQIKAVFERFAFNTEMSHATKIGP